MPETVPRRVKLDALTLVAAGHTRDHVASLMQISKPTIARAKRKLRLYGDIEGGKQKSGRRAKFTAEIINVIHFLLFSQTNRLIRWLFK